MTLQRQRHFIGGDAMTVIGNFNHAPTGFFDGDGDRFRTGIEGIFDQLLNHRCGSFDHFAGGDLGGKFGRENLNGHEGIIYQSRIA